MYISTFPILGPPPSDTITYNLVAGLLEIADNCPEERENIINTLWAYAGCIVQLMSENGKVDGCFMTER